MNVTGLSKPEVAARLRHRQFELVRDQHYDDAHDVADRLLPTIQNSSGETLADAYFAYQEKAEKMGGRQGLGSFGGGVLGVGVGVGLSILVGHVSLDAAVVGGIVGIPIAFIIGSMVGESHYARAGYQAKRAAQECLEVRDLLARSPAAPGGADYNPGNGYLVSEFKERAEKAFAGGRLERVAPLRAAVNTLESQNLDFEGWLRNPQFTETQGELRDICNEFLARQKVVHLGSTPVSSVEIEVDAESVQIGSQVLPTQP